METPNTTYTPPAIIRGGFTIRTKFLPPTNTRGARVKAWRVDTNPFIGGTQSVTRSFHATTGDAHDYAVQEWFNVHGRNIRVKDGCVSKLLRGSVEKGHTFTILFE